MELESATEKSAEKPTEAKDTLRPLSLALLSLTSFIYAIAFIPITLCAFTSPLFANTHQSHPIETLEVYFLVLYFVSFPLLIIGSVFFGWKKFVNKDYRQAIALSLLPIGYYCLYIFVEFIFDYLLKPLFIK